MKFESIKSDGMKYEYKVLFSADEIEDEIKNAVAEIGKACDNIIKEVGAQELASRPTYRFEKNYDKENGAELTVVIEAAPAFELRPYDIEITKITPNVTEEDVAASRKELMENIPLYEKADADYAICPQDEVFYKAICYVGGVESKKKSFEDAIVLPMEIKDDVEFLKGFVGKKVHESFEFSPATDKNLKYKVIVKSVKRALKDISPEEFAAKRGLKDIAELDVAIRNALENDIVMSAFLYHKNQVLDALSSQYNFELPKGVVEVEMRNVLANVKRELAEAKKQGTASEEDLKKTDDDLEKEYAEVVGKRVLLGYVLNKIAKAENIGATDTEIHNAIIAEIRANPMAEKAIVNYYSNNSGAVAYKKAEIIEHKVVSFLISKAKANEVAKTKKEVEKIVSELLED